jgi:hypothetical protein
MRFVCKEKGAVDIEFSDEEIKIFSETKKLTLTPLAVRHFENNLMKVIAQLHKNLPEEIKEVQSEDGIDNEVPTK